MAPFSKAVSVRSSPSSSAANVRVYVGDIDPDWSVGSVPNGGYILALILEACIRQQSNTAHMDPIHITAHYLRPSSISPFEVHITTLKTGKGFTNLTANLLQNGVVKVMSHVIFGVNKSSPNDPLKSLEPPSSYARRVPLYNHPSEGTIIPMHHRYIFHKHLRWTDEPEIRAKNKPDSPSRTNSSSVGGGGLEWGAWCEFTGEEERITSPSLVFLVDIFLNTPVLLPHGEREAVGTSWFPTVTLAVEFKAPIPPPLSKHAAKTVGIYSLGRFVTQPQGRHDVYCEVWSAPSNIAEGKATDGWRDGQVCLAAATQMALTVPMERNTRNATKETPKL